MEQNDNRPLMVSIRCLVFNQENFLRNCLDSIVMQKTNFRFEAIVHDDASTDGSAKIIMEYANKYPDIIKPILEKENQFSKHNGSIGRIMDKACIGKYIAYCEGDDYWTDPYKLQKQVDIMETHKNVMMVYTAFDTVDEDGSPVYRFEYDYNMKISKSGFVFPSFIFRNVAMTVSCMFRREVFTSDIRRECNVGMDYLYFLSAAALGDVVYLNDKTCNYRKAANSVTNAHGEKVRATVIYILDYVTELYENGKIPMSKVHHFKTRTYIAAKGIDLAIKRFGCDYLKKHCIRRSTILYLPIGLILNLKLNVCYYISKFKNRI